jgi:hypothetical protein
VGTPRTAEIFLAFKNDEAGTRKLLCEVVGATDSRDASADDQHVEVLGLNWCGLF